MYEKSEIWYKIASCRPKRGAPNKVVRAVGGSHIFAKNVKAKRKMTDYLHMSEKSSNFAAGSCKSLNTDTDMKKLFTFLLSVIASIALAQAQSTSNDSDVANEADEKVYIVVEKMPEFPGGQQALFDYLSANVQYPKIARENGIQGRSIVQFVVNKDGSISDVEIVRSGGDPSLDREAIRVIRSMPNGIPGRQGGKLIRVKYTVPVNFRLTGDDKK